MPDYETVTDSDPAVPVDSVDHPEQGEVETVTESEQVMPAAPVPVRPVTVLGAPGSIVSGPPKNVEGDAGLRALFDSAKPPCVIVLRDEADIGTVQRWASETKGTYAVKVKANLPIRGIWRQM